MKKAKKQNIRRNSTRRLLLQKGEHMTYECLNVSFLVDNTFVI